MSVRLNSHLSDKQLLALRDKLLAEAERIRTNFQLKKNEYENSLTTGGKDEVDSANDNILLAADMRFSNRESLYYKKIMKTLSKVENEQSLSSIYTPFIKYCIYESYICTFKHLYRIPLCRPTRVDFIVCAYVCLRGIISRANYHIENLARCSPPLHTEIKFDYLTELNDYC
jgi:hypothetical protein